MSGYLGTRSRPIDLNGEFTRLEVRSSDPSNPPDGLMWLRDDLTGTNKLGELRINLNGTTAAAPVYDTAEAVSNGVVDVLRVQLSATIGYVPLAPRADATFPQLSFKHNDQLYGLHDNSTVPQITVIDDFEDGDLTEYTVTNDCSTVNSNTYEGDWYLELFSGSDEPELYSTSGLNDYPASGDVFSVIFESVTNTPACIFRFGLQDASSFYQVNIDPSSDDLSLRRYDNGSSTQLAIDNGSTINDTVLDCEIDWDSSDTTITVTLYEYDTSTDSRGTEFTSISANDDTYTSGGIGFNIGVTDKSDQSGHFDYVRIPPQQ